MIMGKQEIINTRIGGFGSSDAKLFASIGKRGKIGKTALKRIEVMLGMRAQRNFSNASTRYGDYIESELYKSISQAYKGYKIISNPYCEVKELPYSFKCFNHIDIEMVLPKRLIWIEVKAVNQLPEQTINEYKEQLCWHWWILEQESKKRKLTGELYLGHYHTKDKTSPFDPDNLSIHKISYDDDMLCDIAGGLEITQSELENIKEGRLLI